MRYNKLVDIGRIGIFIGFTNYTIKYIKVYYLELRYIYWSSRVLVDKKIKGGTIVLKLRGLTSP